MPETQRPNDSFKFRRVPRDVPPHFPEFIRDTSRMDEIVDYLAQELIEPDSVMVSTFVPQFTPELDRPITSEDFLLLTEIIKLRTDLSFMAMENDGLKRDILEHMIEDHPDSPNLKNPKKK